MAKITDEEKKERLSKVTRFGKERFPDPDEPVEYKPLVRKGGRKQGKADMSQSRVPVKSSVSNPFDEKSRHSLRRAKRQDDGQTIENDEAFAVQEEEKRIRRIRPRTALMDGDHIFTDDKSLKMPKGFISSDEYEEKLPEEEQATIQEKAINSLQETDLYDEEFSWDNFEDLLSLSASDRVNKSKKDNAADKNEVSAKKEFEKSKTAVHRTLSEPVPVYEEKIMSELTPFDRRKKAIEYGVPPRFFYLMSKEGFLDGATTQEDVRDALDSFYRKRVAERLEGAMLSAEEFQIVAEEIDNINLGRSSLFSPEDFGSSMSPDEICKMVIDKIRRNPK